MFTVSVSHNALKALTLVAGTNPERPQLTSVCVDTTTPGRVHLVATDGARLLCVNAVATGDIVAGVWLLPLHEVKRTKQRGTDRYPTPITISILVCTAEYAIEGKETVTGRLLSEQYPPWRKVIPRKFSGKQAVYDLNYLGDFGRVAELLACKYPAFRHNGKSAALFDFGADAFGVLMPIREPREAGELPEWFDAPKVEEQAAA